MEGHCNDDLMEDEIVEAMPRRVKGSGGFKDPNNTPSFPIAIPPILWLTLLIAGYALIEYEKFEEAKAAILGMNGAKPFGQTISGDWAFSIGPLGTNLRSPNRSRSARRRY